MAALSFLFLLLVAILLSANHASATAVTCTTGDCTNTNSKVDYYCNDNNGNCNCGQANNCYCMGNNGVCNCEQSENCFCLSNNGECNGMCSQNVNCAGNNGNCNCGSSADSCSKYLNCLFFLKLFLIAPFTYYYFIATYLLFSKYFSLYLFRLLQPVLVITVSGMLCRLLPPQCTLAPRAPMTTRCSMVTFVPTLWCPLTAILAA